MSPETIELGRRGARAAAEFRRARRALGAAIRESRALRARLAETVRDFPWVGPARGVGARRDGA